MKKIALLIFAALFAVAHIAAQDCNCGSIKFRVMSWKCQGKNAAGFPVYSGILNVGNGPGCTFKLLEIMQQTAGDVSLAMPLTVPPNTIVNTPITFTDNPPFIGAGNSAAFILVFTRGDKKCKIEVVADKLPPCLDSACKCNPTAAWAGFVAKIGSKPAMKVRCGYQFALTCKDTVSLKGLYKCMGNCNAQYVAVLKNTTTNTVVQNFSPFNFPWNYKFAAPGNYSLEITPICGDKKCSPCRFFFTVANCDTACDCNPQGWQPFQLSASGGTQTIQCGAKVVVKKGAPVKLTGKYTCKGNCDTRYTAVLTNGSTGAVLQTYPSFSFPFTYNFPATGVYRLEITPVCGGKKCSPCVIFFSVQ